SKLLQDEPELRMQPVTPSHEHSLIEERLCGRATPGLGDAVWGFPKVASRLHERLSQTSSPNQSRLYGTLITLRDTRMSSNIGPWPARNSSTPALTPSNVRACWPRQPNARATAPRSGVGMVAA